MLKLPLILALLTTLSACVKPIPDSRILVPEVSEDLRTPVPISDRRADTLRDLSLLATEHLNSAKAANAKIVTIDQILTCAEARATGAVCQETLP